MVGEEGGYPDLDAYLIKTDSSGNFIWSETFGGIGTDGVRSVIQSPDGGIVLTGSTNSIGAGNSDFYLIYYKKDIVAGDFNNDGDVDGLDLAAFIANPNGVNLAELAAHFGS